MSEKRNALGRGLTALLQSQETDVSARNPVPVNGSAEINISEIEANPFQPRKEFDEAALEELAESILTHGVIQPITVRKIGYGKYELISGERRTRAAIRAGLKTIPAFVRVANDQSMLEMALVENTHRQDLNAIEIAFSYQRLLDECKITQEEMSKRVGKNRSTVTNFLRLLKLPEEIQIALRDDQISMGHARAILGLDNREEQILVLESIIDNDLTVRQVEAIVRSKTRNLNPVTPVKNQRDNSELSADEWALRLAKTVAVPSKIKLNATGKGQLTFYFSNTEELEKIVGLIEG